MSVNSPIELAPGSILEGCNSVFWIIRLAFLVDSRGEGRCSTGGEECCLFLASRTASVVYSIVYCGPENRAKTVHSSPFSPRLT